MGPSDRCGFTHADSHCCWRESWRDAGRCVWHAESDDEVTKPAESLRAARADRPTRERTHGTGELLNGADIAGEHLPDGTDLHGVCLRDADLTDADLRGVDLSDADLRGADLTDADLREADLAGTNCRDADLHESDLIGADLSDAMLRGVDLTDAILRDADLVGTNLEGALLNRADLFGADLSDARLYGAILATARINDATTLDSYCVYDPTRGDAVDVGSSGLDAHVGATSTYQQLERLCAENSLLDAHSRYFVRRQDIHSIEHRDEGRWGRWLRARFARAVVLYGESPLRVLGSAAAVILLSTLLYPLGYLRNSTTGELLTYPPFSRPIALVHTLLDSFYFSTLSFTTMTYGQFVPVGVGRFLTMFETGSGVVLIALLVFVFGRRATR